MTIPPAEKIRSDSYRDAQRLVTSDSGIVVVPRNYSFSSLTALQKPQRLFEPPLLASDKATVRS